MSPLPTLREVWDVLVFLMLGPVVGLMAFQLPGDLAHHEGESLQGTATVTRLEATARGGEAPVVEVRDVSGVVVATNQEVNGDPVREVGASFDVSYLPPDAHGNTQVYTDGHDPFSVNVLVLLLLGLAWMASLPFIAARVWRGARRLVPRSTPKPGSHYSAGKGYISG